jgi:hypothetical protein
LLALRLSLAALPLAGCSSTLASLPLVGEPADAPKAPADPGSFPAVHDLPPPRADTMMGTAEQAQVEKELAAARERQAAEAAAADAADAAPAARK